MSEMVASNRLPMIARWSAAAVALVAVILLVRALPVDRGIEALREWIDGQGAVGLIVFAAAYIIAALLFVPGSALTLAAGAVFGLWIGTAVVSLASTSAAAVAFLVARFLARRRVEGLARKHPRFGAIDRAIGTGGWKIIAMLRLSPAVPFSAGNYLFGLTAVRFVPYLLASWAFMLPGTFMYVYLGYLGAAGLSAAEGGAERTPGQWLLLIVGLIATVAVTIYVTKLARKALKEQSIIDDGAEDRAGVNGSPATTAASSRSGWSVGTFAGITLALVLSGAAVWANLQRDQLRGLFGPPDARLVETYEQKTGGPIFDHSLFDELLEKHVSANGEVDYDGFRKDAGDLDRYLEQLAQAPFEGLGRDEKLALLINAYNAFTIRLILDHHPSIESIKDIPDEKRWVAERWQIGSKTDLSLNEIEHIEIRDHFAEPRIHFALVCAARGCPPLRSEAYTGASLEEQLESQTHYVHDHPRWLRLEPERGIVHLTRLYQWYGHDFRVAGNAESVLDYAARYSPPLETWLDSSKPPPTIAWIDYDWALNDKESSQ